MQVWLIQRYSSFELPVHGKRPNQRIKDNLVFLLDYLHNRYSRLPAAFPLFCNFAIDIFKHVTLHLIFLHITYTYSFHCILHHMFYWLLFPTPSNDHPSLVLASFSFLYVELTLSLVNFDSPATFFSLDWFSLFPCVFHTPNICIEPMARHSLLSCFC